MSVKKFKFVSPGVFTREIDNSQLPAVETPSGPIVIGRLPQGPAMEPVKIDSFSQFVEVFGNPVPGKATGDVWRVGNYQGPTYASYAAQAYLRNSADSMSIVRLAGLASEDVGTGGEAGWTVQGDVSASVLSNAGAYGMYLCASGSGAKNAYLAAIWYIYDGGAVGLSGTLAEGGTLTGGVGGLIDPSSDIGSSKGPDYQAYIKDTSGAEVYKTTFNFDPSSRTFIRKVFNTNPQTLGGVLPAGSYNLGESVYWLGETYESFIQKQLDLGNLDDSAYGLIMPFDKAAKADYTQDFTKAKTGWFFSQDLSTATGSYLPQNMQKLFRLHATEPGKWVQDNIKVSIQGLTYSRSTTGANNYSSFTVVLRKVDDTDKVVKIVERFSNVNLNPLSDNYIAKKIGDRYSVWDQSVKLMREYGEYSNASKYVRVEVNDTVRNGIANADFLPFGVNGPDKFVDVGVSASIDPATIVEDTTTSPDNLSGSSPGNTIATGSTITSYAATLKFPEMILRNSSSAGNLYAETDAYFGMTAAPYLENSTLAYASSVPGTGYPDYVYSLPAGVTDAMVEPMWRFSLDDVVQPLGKNYAHYSASSRAAGTSYSATGSWRDVIDSGWTRFTAPLYGGFDGLEIIEIEPFRNFLLDADSNRNTNYAMNTLRTAIEVIADPETVNCNMVTIPGITNTNITTNLVETCEDRADALALIDIPEVYTPFTETSAAYSDPASRAGTVSQAVLNLEERQIDSSYGCTYYPWVQIQDTVTTNNRLWVPPSVVVLGTLASSDAVSEVWFAPAGFNRGGLSGGSSGLPVLNVSQRLTSKNRDTLYDANINPIASFPNEGIVIFGQKTLQVTPSALDRINVRRMLIFVKKQISIFANTILFDQNVEVTWNRFKALAEPFLASVETRLGLSDYRLVLDNTTTTPDLVDRNIMYAKIFLKPAKAIEFIALDFVITNQGAGFED
jgi:hypothetical protein